MLHNVVVMDQLAEAVAVCLGRKHLLGHFDRAADAEAKTGGLGDAQFPHASASGSFAA